MTIDPTTDLGKIRLRVGDFLDIQVLPDAVYTQTITDTKNIDGSSNLVRASLICAQYILASLAFGTHQKLQLIEVWGAEAFTNYKQFLTMISKDPAYLGFAPTPYGASGTDLHPILQFQQDWLNNYAYGTQSQQLHLTALGGVPQNPNTSYF